MASDIVALRVSERFKMHRNRQTGLLGVLDAKCCNKWGKAFQLKGRLTRKGKCVCLLLVMSVVQVAILSCKRHLQRYGERFLEENILKRDFAIDEACGNFPCFGESLCFDRSRVTVKLNHSSHVVENQWFAMTGVLKTKYGVRHNSTFKTPFPCPRGRCDASVTREVFAAAKFRSFLCEKFNQKRNCDFPGFLRSWPLLKRLKSLKGRLDPELIRISTPLQCATQRLADRLVRRVTDVNNDATVLLRHRSDADKTKLLLLCKVSPETVVQKLFPSSEGWPFPTSYGMCGNVIVHATPTVGTLFDVYDKPWKVRLDVAIQILNLAHFLTENDSKYTVLMHKLTPFDLGLSQTGRLRIRNAGDVIILDQEDSNAEFKELKHKKTFTIHNSKVCDLARSDVNYYAVCRNLLGGDWKGGNGDTFQGGLLHDPIEFGDVKNQIFVLLDLCVRGSDAVPRDQRGGVTSSVRMMAAGKLRELLMKTRECDARFAYRYPECELMDRWSDVYRLPTFELEWLP